jgi:hypothetical protein
MFSKTLLLLLLAGACADSKAPITYGSTTKAALVAEKGAPQASEKPIAGSPVEMLVYENGEKYQVSGDVVVAGFKEPLEEESSLLYWRHKLKDCPTTFEVIGDQAASHLHAEKELKCARDGISVIYDPNIDKVVRVVEHAKK